jgi:hypothetical protein
MRRRRRQSRSCSPSGAAWSAVAVIGVTISPLLLLCAYLPGKSDDDHVSDGNRSGS